jgi:hypothetical protein
MTEMMKLQGLRVGAYRLGWIAFHTVFNCYFSIIFALSSSIVYSLTNENFNFDSIILLFIYCLTYGFSQYSLSVFVLSFMHKLNQVIPVAVASNAGAFLLFAFIPEMSRWAIYVIAIIVPNVSMQLGSVVIMNLISKNNGLSLSMIDESIDTFATGGNLFTILESSICSFISGIFFLILSIYLEETLRRPYGVRRINRFCCRKQEPSKKNKE